jgi:hypothetical protein
MLIVLTYSLRSNAQLNMTVNSLADDEYSYAWDDPATPEDESIDGICNDELGRCTIRAAIDESNNMSQSLDLFFSVSGQIDLMEALYPVDGSNIIGNDQVELTGDICFELENDCQIERLIFNELTYAAINIYGDNNTIGPTNIFLNNSFAVDIWGNSNLVGSNYFGIDQSNNLGPNNIAINVTGSANTITTNRICGSNLAGISIGEGEDNVIKKNYIGTNSEGHSGLGNVIGIMIDGSGYNWIGGEFITDANFISENSVAGISISGVPPDNYSIANLIQNNFIGQIPNSQASGNGNGIIITNGAQQEFILENTILGNTLNGIYIFGQEYEETKTLGHTIGENLIGIDDSGVHYPNGLNGVLVFGNVEDVRIGYSTLGDENTIVGNQGNGISIISGFGINPSKIEFRKNKIYENNTENVFLSPQTNNGVLPPYSLSFNNNTIAGIHDAAGALIDIYKADINEFSPSAYLWIGSTTVGSNNVFSYEITDPSIEAVSLTATTATGNTSAFGYLELITGVEKEDNNIPTEFSLSQNFPNPFNPSTTIKFTIPEEKFVSLKVYNTLGEEVAELINETKPAGNYSVMFDANDLVSGIYFYTISAGSFFQTRKMMLVK